MTIRLGGAVTACVLAATLTGCSSSGGGDNPTVSSPASTGSGAASSPASSPASTPASTDGTTAGGGSENGGSLTAGDACGVVSKAQIEGVLGVTLTAGKASGASPVSICMYDPTAGASTSTTVLVRTQSESDHEQFLVGKKGFAANGEETQDASGFGDEAYTSVIGQGRFAAYTINVRKGSVELLVTVSGPKGSLENVESIARLGLQRL